MRVPGPSSGRLSRLLLPLFFVLTCSIASFGKGSHNNSNHGTYGGNSYGNQALSISAIGPSSGPSGGGTVVTIAGAGFSQSASVAFGGTAASTVTYVSSVELLAVTPVHGAGTVSVAVTGGRHNQSATLTGAFTYTSASANTTAVGISGISPSQGPTSGGTLVTVTGTGFQTGATVAFGGIQSTTVTVASPTQINAISPPENSGTVSITVTSPDSHSTSMPSAFTYTSGPSISSVSPSSGPVTGGTTVTILGSGFQSGASVAFGGITAPSVKLVSPTEIQAVTPTSPAGAIAVAVANPDSQAGTLASAFTFYHTVGIAWAANTSPVAGYNIYRGSTSGGPYARLNPTLIPGTSFSDNSVQSGYTYFYVVTAVNSNEVESGYSNQAPATVPSP